MALEILKKNRIDANTKEKNITFFRFIRKKSLIGLCNNVSMFMLMYKKAYVNVQFYIMFIKI